MIQKLVPFVAGAALALAGVYALAPAHAQDSRQAECKLFVASPVGGADKQYMRGVGVKNVAPEVELWMNEHLKGGKTQFISSGFFSSDSVLCAW